MVYADVCSKAVVRLLTIGIEHVYPCINICRVTMMLFNDEADRPSVLTSSEGTSKW